VNGDDEEEDNEDDDEDDNEATVPYEDKDNKVVGNDEEDGNDEDDKVNGDDKEEDNKDDEDNDEDDEEDEDNEDDNNVYTFIIANDYLVFIFNHQLSILQELIVVLGEDFLVTYTPENYSPECCVVATLQDCISITVIIRGLRFVDVPSIASLVIFHHNPLLLALCLII